MIWEWLQKQLTDMKTQWILPLDQKRDQKDTKEISIIKLRSDNRNIYSYTQWRQKCWLSGSNYELDTVGAVLREYEEVLGPKNLTWLKWEKKTAKSNLIICFNWITLQNYLS
jgi:hypothetical protein